MGEYFLLSDHLLVSCSLITPNLTSSLAFLIYWFVFLYLVLMLIPLFFGFRLGGSVMDPRALLGGPHLVMLSRRIIRTVLLWKSRKVVNKEVGKQKRTWNKSLTCLLQPLKPRFLIVLVCWIWLLIQYMSLVLRVRDLWPVGSLPDRYQINIWQTCRNFRL